MTAAAAADLLDTTGSRCDRWCYQPPVPPSLLETAFTEMLARA